MSFRASTARTYKPANFVSQTGQTTEERKVFAVVSRSDTDRSKKTRKMSEDYYKKTDHSQKPLKKVLKGYCQKKKPSKVGPKKAPHRKEALEPKFKIETEVLDLFSELRIESAKVAALLSNQLFQIKKNIRSECLRVCTFYDHLIYNLQEIKLEHQSAIEKSQSELTASLNDRLSQAESSLEMIDSLLEIFVDDPKVDKSDLNVLADIIKQSCLPEINSNFSKTYANFENVRPQLFLIDLSRSLHSEDAQVYSQRFTGLNSIAQRIGDLLVLAEGEFRQAQYCKVETGSGEASQQERAAECEQDDLDGGKSKRTNSGAKGDTKKRPTGMFSSFSERQAGSGDLFNYSRFAKDTK